MSEPGSSCPPLLLARDLATGLLIGAMTDVFGVGGFLIVPTLAIGLALSMASPSARRLAIVTTTSVIALTAHLVAGRGIDLGRTAARVSGALTGAMLAARVPQRQLGQRFATPVTAYRLCSAAFLGGPPGGF